MQMASGEYTISSTPTPIHVGGYDITGGNGKTFSVNFMYTKKPNIIKRLFAKWLLGWNWFDNK